MSDLVSKKVKLMADEKSLLTACTSEASSASSQVRWLGVKAELAAFAAKLQTAKVPATRAIACTASYFVEHVGTVITSAS